MDCQLPARLRYETAFTAALRAGVAREGRILQNPHHRFESGRRLHANSQVGSETTTGSEPAVL